ncbi:PP2C family protein-serine/threonine phosphatase [uncultured Streptomyces sp.]|uniref:PP2C family protein-serine/threonine phosphatase n=1 Tax=uncultured Streptomyces sp. TaxID=174707 RepID=UPI002632DC9C|nr:PP2C family protein-serine/threonine phosphatase [uncultured Streptomyces sp.]
MNGRRVSRAVRWAALVPYAIIVAVVLVDVLAQSAVLLSLLAAPPALTAATGRPRAVLMTGGVALAVCLGVVLADEVSWAGRGWAALGAVAFVTLAAAQTSAVRVRAGEAHQQTKRELVDVRAVADVAQEVILGPVPRVNGRIELAVSYTSATVGARIGGDLYEALTMPDGRTRLLVGDVQGKGLTAVRTAVTVLTAFRAAAPGTGGLSDVAQHIEEALKRREHTEKFVTAVLADCTPGGEVTLLNFGHPPPLVRRTDASVRAVGPEVPGPPLGLPHGLGRIPLDDSGSGRIRLEPGDRLLFYTDGTTEARNRHGAFFALPQIVRRLGHRDLDHDLTALRKALARHTGGPLNDDAALLLLRFNLAPGDDQRG